MPSSADASEYIYVHAGAKTVADSGASEYAYLNAGAKTVADSGVVEYAYLHAGVKATPSPHAAEYIYLDAVAAQSQLFFSDGVAWFKLESVFQAEERHEDTLREANDYTNAKVSSVKLNELADVVATSPVTGQVIRWTGTQWANATVALNELSDVDTATVAPTTGQALVWDGTQWEPGTISSATPTSLDSLSDVDTTTVAPTTGQALVWDGAQWEPGTVSGGSSLKDRRWAVPTGWTSIDEFSDDTLDAAWVRVDSAGASRAVWTEGADVLSVRNEGGDAANEIHALMRPLATPLAIGEAIVTAFRLFGPNANYTMGGIVIADGTTYGAGNQVITLNYLTGTGPIQNNDARPFTNYSAQGTTSSPNIVTNQGALTYVRLVYTATDTWRCDVSPDGVNWLTHGGTATKTVTQAHVGLLTSSWGSTTKGVTSYEFIRRMTV